MPNRLTDLARAAVPTRWRRWLRRAAVNAPQRLRDLPADLASLATPSAFGGPIPPPSLRARVGQLSRRVFRSVGVDGSRQIQAAFARTRAPGRAYPDWLDFGCGCGRIARYVAGLPEVGNLHGADVDADLVGWAARSLAHCGRFATMRPDPPLAFADASFDVVYAISIFTHYTEAEQLAWLDELRRVLRPGGLLLATTIAPSLAGAFPGVSARDLARLEESGFLCVNADSASFNERAAFHSPDYLRAHWGTRFAPRLHETSGFVGYQDLTVWERP
ncbi:MAG TPA: class I SAM-dependent methyltransferase [Thermoanaerobaculia bacterium]|jgi:SAM-dependent methyltransferase